MKNLLFFLLSLIALCSCSGESYKVGDKIKIITDCPSADSYWHIEELEEYIESKEYPKATQMLYDGNAAVISEGSYITILEVNGDYYKTNYHTTETITSIYYRNRTEDFVHYTYRKALNRNGKKIK